MFCAQFGNADSYYGNIEYGVFLPIPIQTQGLQFGGWPDEIKPNGVMLTNRDTLVVDTSKNVEIIRRLRAKLTNEEDTKRRKEIRKQIDQALADKNRAFRLAARIDEEESFILLH